MKPFLKLKERPDLWPIYIAALGWLVFSLVSQLWPDSWWLEVRSVHVENGRAGAAIVMHVDRSISRPFDAVWTAQVRTIGEAGEMGYVACTTSAFSSYKVGANLPKMLTLDWWTDGRCPSLPAGRYMLSTTWRIEPSGLLPEKMVHSNSNVFEVLP